MGRRVARSYSESMTNDSPDTRASDAERERVAEYLREAVAEGRLDMEEFGERLEAAYEARTHGELAPLVSDLPTPGSTVDVIPVAGSPAPAGGWAERIGAGGPVSRTAFAFMGGFSRKGSWTVPRAFTSLAFMGGGEIDLREARFEDRDVVIRCFAFMGGIGIIVPADMDVHVRGFGVMGGFGEPAEAGEIGPGSPRVIVTGFAVMGGVGVERKLRESEKRRTKEQRRREKLEKKAERKESR
jgi:hypothetical protein